MKKILSLILFIASFVFSQAQYNALLWKVTGNGLKQPSYVYGTMHTSDERIIKLGDKAVPYLKETKLYAMELDPKMDLDFGLLAKVMMGKGYSLKKMIPAKEYATLDSVVNGKLGYPMMLFDNVSPIFIMTLFQMDGMGLEQGGEGATFLDMYLYKQADKKRIKAVGIETVDEQISALNVLSYEEQAEMLMKEIRNLGTNTDEQDLVKHYLAQELDSVADMEGDTSMPPKLYKALVTDRNARMAERIADFVQKQATFAAVGALHLPGAQGVIALLRKKGYTVEAVKL